MRKQHSVTLTAHSSRLRAGCLVTTDLAATDTEQMATMLTAAFHHLRAPGRTDEYISISLLPATHSTIASAQNTMVPAASCQKTAAKNARMEQTIPAAHATRAPVFLSD